MPDLPITELPAEKSAGMFDSIKDYAAKNPELTADVLTAGGMTGLGAIMSGISGAVEAPPGYRMEAARRDALMGGLGGLSSFAALKGSQKFFNEGAAHSPVAAAAAGLGGYAMSKALSDARYPILLSLMGRPSWEVRPDNVDDMVRAELLKQRRREQRRLLKKGSSNYFRNALFSTPLQYNNQSSVWQNILSHLRRVHARGADELKGDNFITRWRASLQPPQGITLPQGPQLSGLDHFVYKGANAITPLNRRSFLTRIMKSWAANQAALQLAKLPQAPPGLQQVAQTIDAVPKAVVGAVAKAPGAIVKDLFFDHHLGYLARKGLEMGMKQGETIDVNQKEASSKLRSLFKLVADPTRSSAMRTWYDMMLKGKPVGFLKALQTPGGVRAENMELLPHLQGMGLGRKALGDLMRQTKQPLLSGWQVSPYAQKALQRMGQVPGRALTQLTDQVKSTPMRRQGGMQLNAPEGTDIFKLTQKQAGDRVRVVMPYQGRYLLEKLLNKKYPQNLGKIRFPGGGVDEGETHQQAAVREMQEELSTEVDPAKLRYLGQDSRPEMSHEHYYQLDEHPLRPGRYKTNVGGDAFVRLIRSLPAGPKYMGADLSTLKQADDLDTLGEAKQLSDVKRYQEKHIKLRQMMLRDPTAWYVDNRQGPMYGVTHRRTRWRFHLPPRVIPRDVLKQAAGPTVAGGYSPERWVARTAGRVLGAPAALLIGHESAPSWLAEEDEKAHAAAARTMAKSFPKELRHTAVRLGGTDTPDDLKRLWGSDLNPLLKAYLSVGTVQGNLMSNLQRSSHYNPLTNAATVYGNVPHITAHELGHAADFNSKGNWQLPYILSAIPERQLGLSAGPMTHWMEIAANRNVHKAYKSHPNADQEMAEAWRRLAPAYGTYGAATALGGLALHHHYAANKRDTPLSQLAQGTNRFLGKYLSSENAKTWTPVALGLGFTGAGALAGRTVAELRNAIAALRKRFSTEKKKEPRK